MPVRGVVVLYVSSQASTHWVFLDMLDLATTSCLMAWLAPRSMSRFMNVISLRPFGLSKTHRLD